MTSPLFGFELARIVENDSVSREAVTKDQMRKFLKFVHDNVVYILFYTGMRLSDIDIKEKIINIDHQLHRSSKMEYIIENIKTNVGIRKIRRHYNT